MPPSKKSKKTEQDPAVKPKGKAGRPRWKPPSMHEVEVLAERGLTFEQIAGIMGISLCTLQRRKKELAQFDEALKRGRAKGIAAVANKLYKAAIEKEDVSAQKFIMERVGGWRARETIEVTGADGKPIKVKAIIKADKEIIKLLEDYVDVARAAVANTVDAESLAGNPTGESTGSPETDGSGESVDSGRD
jgi:hypothetical protein